MAFRNMNRKRHIGLQQLSSLASIGRSLLGPVKSSKFFFDESTCGSTLICSAVKLLENLDLSSAVGQLLNEAVQAQHNEFKTGTTTLLFLVGAWSNAVLECLQQDVPVSVIVTVMSESLDSCIEHVQCLSISIEKMQQKLGCVPVEGNDKAPIDTSSGACGRQIFEIPAPDIKSNDDLLNSLEHLYLQASEEKSSVPPVNQVNTCKSWEESMFPSVLPTRSTAYSLAKSGNGSYVYTVCKNNLGRSSHNKRLKLTHSRYFSSARENNSQQKTEHWDESAKHSDGPSDLKQLAMSLSHGNWPCMKLVQDILKFQLQTSSKMADTHPFQFNISEVVTCCLPGMSESHSCVYPGYITLVCPEKAAVAKQLQDRPLRIILADGDLTETYHHLGFNRSPNVRMVLEGVNIQDSNSSLWVDSMLDILLQSRINLILVHGNACENLEGKCLLNNIVIINRVPHCVLKAFSDITQAERVTYLTQG
ncbi:Bardet-Biedl syndrome 12 protein homolog isoform X2 [Hemicordylus capensis]|uniref:Bardet-Biedl syndrome 12 protein homolog isoform X2 n=1 Tax=Hemicordylus capensis TaxID=884348 RepID=UPI002303BB49|nr:Bardet-Biedl syndrome 12 protein homolog isoform X2 [Hemicordylus capensis]